MRKPKLIDVFPDWLTGSAIFNALDTMDVPWKEDIAGSILDLEYYGNISGNKTTAPLVRRMLNADNVNVLSASRVTQLAQMIYKMNISNWTREYATLFEEYNPISNYDMTESETHSNTESGSTTNTGTQANAHTGTETDRHTGTDTLDMGGTITSGHTGTQGVQESATSSGTTSSTTNNGIYGFNSSSASDSDTSTTSGTTSNQSSGSSTRTDALQDLDTYDRTDERTLDTTDAKTFNDTLTRTDNLSETRTGSDSGSRTLTRSGNIGVTTSQQMIQSERDLYMWNFFYNVVFPGVDKVLALQTYNI